MKTQFILVVVVAVIAALCLPPVFAQATGTVKGVCTDVEGKPIAGATVEYRSLETGRKYALKTNNKGEFFSLGIAPGKYDVTLSKDGKELFHFNGFPVTLNDETNILNFDLKKEQQRAAQGQGLSPEQLKQQQEQQAKAAKENANIKNLNEKLAASRQAMAAGNFDEAVQAMTEATQLDATKDLIWFTLGDAYSGAAKKLAATDRASAKLEYAKAVEAYQKAIAIKPTADYYNNMAQAMAGAGQLDDAVKAYDQAAQLDPTRASMFYFNKGAVQTNSGKVDDAIESFKKLLAIDPNKADAYYWLGVNLISKATTDPSGKVIPAPGTAEALNKYLELQPNGPNAEGAKGMLQYIGSTIETGYKKKSKSK